MCPKSKTEIPVAPKLVVRAGTPETVATKAKQKQKKERPEVSFGHND